MQYACLGLEPTTNVPGLKEEFSDYYVSSEKEMSPFQAIWRKYHESGVGL